MADDSGTKQWIHSSTKFLVKMKNVFHFYLKKLRNVFVNPIYLKMIIETIKNKFPACSPKKQYMPQETS